MNIEKHTACGSLCCRGCGKSDKQLNTYDWLADIPGNSQETEYVEVQFKNTRKGFFKNSYNIPLVKGDIVAVEATPGHDIGEVTLTGRLVLLQMKKANLRSLTDIKRIYRKARPVDMEKYYEAKKREHKTMIESRQIAAGLNLQMKIGDVEYQGDGGKAIFYYIADERVDFRELIKVLADVFHVRIEMKQIGARQEAGRIGGIGPCGRELCCATWMTSFISVSTNAARFQDISLNPQKLAGLCAKLKCCLNYEVDSYVEAQKRIPSKEIELETKDGTYYFFKADILANTVSYSTDKQISANLVTISSKRAFEIIGMNRRGQKPDSLNADGDLGSASRPTDLLEQDSLTRFDRSKKEKNKKKKRKPKDDGPNGRERSMNNERGNAPAENRPVKEEAGMQEQPQQRDRERNGQPERPPRERERNNPSERPQQRDRERYGQPERPPRDHERNEQPERQPRDRERNGQQGRPRPPKPHRRPQGEQRPRPEPSSNAQRANGNNGDNVKE